MFSEKSMSVNCKFCDKKKFVSTVFIAGID